MAEPCEISVSFNNQIYKIFSKSSEEDVLISYFNFQGEAVNIALEEDEDQEEVQSSAAASTTLFNSHFYFTLLEVKKRLKVGGEKDVLVTFPDLQLYSLHQDNPLLKEFSVNQLVEFLEANCLEKNIPLPKQLSITLEALPNCTRNRVMHLASLLQSGGLATNPIVIDDSTDDTSSDEILYEIDDAGSLDVIGVVGACEEQEELKVAVDDDASFNDQQDDSSSHGVNHVEIAAAVEDTHDDFFVSAADDKVSVAMAMPAKVDVVISDQNDGNTGMASGASPEQIDQHDDGNDDLFTEEDEEEAVERERFLNERASAAIAIAAEAPVVAAEAPAVGGNNDDLILVEEDEEDYLSSSATLAPLLQKLKSAEPSSSLTEKSLVAMGGDAAAALPASHSEIDLADTIDTIEQGLLAVDSPAKRELPTDKEEDIAMGKSFSSVTFYIHCIISTNNSTLAC